MHAIVDTVRRQHAFFNAGKSRTVDFRRRQLKRLQDAILAHEANFYDAFREDLHKPPLEVFGAEIGMVLKEIRHHLKMLPRWAAPTRVRTDLTNFPATSRIRHEPFGVTLIMAPWNYPFQLALMPLVGAISAGNCAILKPAHDSTRVSALIARMIAETFADDYIAAFTGGREVNQALLDQRFDLIFFTGSPSLGKIVMQKAAQHLTPVVLELGGKSPCIVDHDARLDAAAGRIAFGKFLNAGQTCIAPDHLFVHRSVKARLVAGIRRWIVRAYGDAPEQSEDYCRIVNRRHFDRLVGLMHASGTIVHGGRSNREARYIEPTLIEKIAPQDPIMQEEIFGPLLPILEFTRLETVIETVNGGERPLALYYFGESGHRRDRLLSAVPSGGGCVNETVMQVANARLPFGGVGNSGMGRYHGKSSFDAFSYQRSILQKSTTLNLTLHHPPYGRKLRYARPILS